MPCLWCMLLISPVHDVFLTFVDWLVCVLLVLFQTPSNCFYIRRRLFLTMTPCGILVTSIGTQTLHRHVPLSAGFLGCFRLFSSVRHSVIQGPGYEVPGHHPRQGGEIRSVLLDTKHRKLESEFKLKKKSDNALERWRVRICVMGDD